MGHLWEQVERVFLEVTNHCNFHCAFCPQAISTRAPRHMDLALAKDLIQQLYSVGYRNNLYFHLLGEPLLYPALFDLLQYTTERLPRSILFTNGSLLTAPIIRSIFEAAPFELMISMQTMDATAYAGRGTSLGWEEYVARIRNAVQYKLAHATPTRLRISVGLRNEESPFPHDAFFPRVAPTHVRDRVLTFLNTIPGIAARDVDRLRSMTFPFRGQLELGPGVFLSVKAMGNWRRMYHDETVERGYCPHIGTELGILSNGDLVLCHLDYDGHTAFTNATGGQLSTVLDNEAIRHEIEGLRMKGIVPPRCQHCIVPMQHAVKGDPESQRLEA